MESEYKSARVDRKATKLEELALINNFDELSKTELIRLFQGKRFAVSKGALFVCNLNASWRKDDVIAAIQTWQRIYKNRENY